LTRFTTDIDIDFGSSLRHPNIVMFYGVCVSPVCLVMELMTGSLETLIGSLEPQTSLTIAKGIAQGMLHLHKCGITHRDLKPANILVSILFCKVFPRLFLIDPRIKVDGALVPKVTDFGISKKLDTVSTNVSINTDQTRSNQL
jgi:serine/threonine protein kinase